MRRRELAGTFFMIGLTSYGGPAIVARIREVTVLEKGWLSDEEFEETLAFVQILPGPVAVQTAAHIGWRFFGGLGVLLALTSYTLPAFLLMLALSAAYMRWETATVVATAFAGLGAVIVGIVAQSTLAMAQPALKDWRGVAIALAAALALFDGESTLLVLTAAALVGALLGLHGADSAPAATDGPSGMPLPSGRYRTTVAWVALVGGAFAAFVLASRLLAPAFPALGLAMTKINLLAFGGGYTAVALMFQEVVRNTSHAWLTPKEFIDGLALGQITPGPVMITATFIGYRVGGPLGAVFGTVCAFLPSALFLTLLAPQFARVRELRAVQYAVRGLLAAFIAMLLHVLAQVADSALVGPWQLALAGGSFVALQWRVNPLWVIVAATAVALLVL